LTSVRVDFSTLRSLAKFIGADEAERVSAYRESSETPTQAGQRAGWHAGIAGGSQFAPGAPERRGELGCGQDLRLGL